MTPKRLLHRFRFWRDWGRELPAEINRRLRPLEEAGEEQVIIDIWVLRQLLNLPPRMVAEQPTKLTKEGRTKEKSKGQAPAEERNRPDHR